MSGETTNINIRMDKDIKEQADSFFAELGMNLTTAINLFIRQSLRQRKIPFELSLNSPNVVTLAAMEEVEAMIRGELPKNSQSVEDLFKELDIDVD